MAAALALAVLAPASSLAHERSRSPLDSAGVVTPPRSLLTHALRSATATGPDYPGAVWEPANPANYTVADRPYTDPIERLIIHVAEGDWASTYTWFRNARAESSAHYVVSSTGRVAQMVPDADIAWHAGNWDYNATSIGIEHAGYTNVTRFADAQYRGSARLAAWLADRYLITPDRKHVIGHYQVPDPSHPGEWGGIDHHTDPGRTWDWARYMAYLRTDAADTPRDLVDNADTARVRYDPAVWRVRSAESGRAGADYLAARPTAAPSPVRFELHVPTTDRYDLMMRWPCGANSARAHVGILAAHGYRTVAVDEARNCGRYRYLGSYELPAGDAWRLEISSASHASGTIVADAFELVEQSDPVAPTAPALTVQPGETQVGLSWTHGTDNVAVGGYHVVVDGALAYAGAARSLTVSGLACGTVHVISVRALDMVSNRSPRGPVWVQTSACPPAPTGLVATPGTGTMGLSWTAPAAGLAYRVFLNSRQVATTHATSYTVTGIRCARTRTFTVESVDSTGSVSAPTAVTAATPPC